MRKIICPININTKAKAKNYYRGINFILISVSTVREVILGELFLGRLRDFVALPCLAMSKDALAEQLQVGAKKSGMSKEDRTKSIAKPGFLRSRSHWKHCKTRDFGGRVQSNAAKVEYILEDECIENTVQTWDFGARSHRKHCKNLGWLRKSALTTP